MKNVQPITDETLRCSFHPMRRAVGFIGRLLLCAQCADDFHEIVDSGDPLVDQE